MNKKVIIALMIIAGTISVIAPLKTQAAESTGSKTGIVNTIKGLFEQTKNNKTEIKNNRKGFEEKFENVTKYVRQDLTKTERESAKKIIESKTKAMETLNKTTKANANSGTQINTGDFIAKATTIYTEFKTAMTPYIDSTKLESFNTLITEKIKLIETNRNLRAANQAIKTTIEDTKKEQKTAKELKAIANESKAVKELIKKIDEVIRKTTTPAIKDALISAKNTLQAQLPAPTTGTVTK